MDHNLRDENVLYVQMGFSLSMLFPIVSHEEQMSPFM